MIFCRPAAQRADFAIVISTQVCFYKVCFYICQVPPKRARGGPGFVSDSCRTVSSVVCSEKTKPRESSATRSQRGGLDVLPSCLAQPPCGNGSKACPTAANPASWSTVPKGGESLLGAASARRCWPPRRSRPSRATPRTDRYRSDWRVQDHDHNGAQDDRGGPQA